MPGRHLDIATFTVVVAVTLLVGATVMVAGFQHHRMPSTARADRQERGPQQVERIRQVRPHVSLPGQVVPTA